MVLLKSKIKMLFVQTSVVIFGSMALAGSITSYQPEALQAVKDLAVAAENVGERPIVIFDLDDTLINTRERTVRIIKSLISQDDVKQKFRREVLALQNLEPEDILFKLADTMKAKGITNARFLKVAQAAWDSHFFTNEFCANDIANPGGVQYVQELARLGVKIVYLTGRDTGRMHDGTVYDLQSLGLPVDDPQAKLIMKQDVTMNDLKFKISMFPTIEEEKTDIVVGVFENEPANINAHHDFFLHAVAIFLDTIHSDTTVRPEPGIAWVKDFREGSFK